MIRKQTSNIDDYASVRRLFCRQIAEGRLKPGDRIDSPEQVSQSLQLGVGTVRHALQQLAEKGILLRKRRSGSFISPDAISLIKGWSLSCSSINVIIPSNPLPESMACFQGIQTEAADHNVTVTISSASMGPEQFDRTICEQLDSGVGGFIFMTLFNRQISVDTIWRIRESGLPVVCCQGGIVGLETYAVTQDNVGNMRKVVGHLVETGRKKIAFVGFNDPQNPMSAKSSHYDFLTVSQMLGLKMDFNRKLFINVPQKSETVFSESSLWHEQIESWLRANKDVDALCCAFDRIAWAAIRAVNDLDGRVPEDIAVTGMGMLNSYYGLPADELTTVGVIAEELGRKACSVLLDACAGKPPRNRDATTLNGTLVIGRSTVGKTA